MSNAQQTYADLVSAGIHDLFDLLLERVAKDPQFDDPDVGALGITLEVLAGEDWLQRAWRAFIAQQDKEKKEEDYD
jgi:hypothetical protein